MGVKGMAYAVARNCVCGRCWLGEEERRKEMDRRGE